MPLWTVTGFQHQGGQWLCVTIHIRALACDGDYATLTCPGATARTVARAPPASYLPDSSRLVRCAPTGDLGRVRGPSGTAWPISWPPSRPVRSAGPLCRRD